MNRVILIVLLLCSYEASCQIMNISGKIILKERSSRLNFAQIVVNDTLDKYLMANLRDTYDQKAYKIYNTLSSDEKFVRNTTADGSFSIQARSGDTLFFKSGRYITKRFLVSELAAKENIVIELEPEPCTTYVPCDQKMSAFYAFIGEKIAVKRAPDIYYCNRLLMDGEYEATYLVRSNIFGMLTTDTVKFLAYDHYGAPAFSQHKYVMLFLEEYCGKLIHSKYQYFDVYPTADGRWATPGDPYRSERVDEDEKTVRAEPLKFQQQVIFDTRKRYPNGVLPVFKKPHYKVRNGWATAILGTYAEDLLQVKLEGTLGNRGININKLEIIINKQ